MRYRTLGNSELKISQVSMGCWAIGGSWGRVDDETSLKTLHAAVDAGVNFFDTADVYGDGRSERLLGMLLKERSEELFIASKAGRRLNPHIASAYTEEAIVAFVERSLTNLKMERLDLLQLHCPPTEVYYQPELFEALERLVSAGKLRHYGVSVEKVEEALIALEYPGVRSIQIIFNLFRQRPAELLLQRAAERGVGILARVPLASGLLTGKLHLNSSFSAEDHRNFNRHGEAFDVGETFSGVPYAEGLEAVEKLKELCPQGMTLAQLALRWILEHPQISAVIPGAKNPQQLVDNCSASEMESLSPELMNACAALYQERIAASVHRRW